MAPWCSLCVLAAAFFQGALADGADASCAKAPNEEDPTALVQLDVQMRLGVERAAPAAAKYALGSNASGASNASGVSSASAASKRSSDALGALSAADSPRQALGSNASGTSNGSGALNGSRSASDASADSPVSLAATDRGAPPDPLAGLKKEMSRWASQGKYLEDTTYRTKVSEAIPGFLPRCIERGYGSQEECELALEQLRILHTSLLDVPPELYVQACRNRMSLSWFLWAPGPPMSFAFVDRDQNDKMTWAELTLEFGPFVMGALEPFHGLLDPDHDGNTTRTEIFDFIRSSILIRDQLPEIDGFNPTAKTSYCLKHLQKMFYKPTLEHHLPRTIKVLGLLALGAFTAVFIVWAECGFRSTRK